MKKPRRQLSIVPLLLFLFVTSWAMAQPGGPGGRPGGRPMGPPPSGMRPDRPGGEFDPNRADQNSKEVRKKVLGNTYKIVGTLRDSTSKDPLIYVNVAALTKADSSFVKGASTDENGYFEVTEVPAGQYLIRISYVGYGTKYIPVTVDNNTAMGTVFLSSGVNTLHIFQVSAERPLYSMDGEKTIYNVSDDPSIQTGTTSDALQNAPGVEVDVEGNITLRGVSSVEIWINDKPSKLTSDNLKTFLETLPANAIARIETITNPSAKYATDADAVINIITNAHIKSNQFISFSLNGSSQPSISPRLSYVWARERLRINFSASVRYNDNESSSASWGMKYRDAEHLQRISVDSSISSSTSQQLGANFGLNISYEFDSTSDVDVWSNINFNQNKSNQESWSLYDETDNGGWRNAYTNTTVQDHDNLLSNYFGMAGFAYTKKFNNKGHNLRIFSFNTFEENNSHIDMSRIYEPTSDTLLTSFYRQNVTHSAAHDLNLRARYNLPLNEDMDLSFGANISNHQTKSTYTPSYQTVSGVYDSVDLLRAYSLTDDGTDLGADVNLTRRWGNLTAEIGLGVGYKHTQFHNDAYNTTAATLYPFLIDDTTYNFLTLSPSIHFTYRTDNMHNFKLNYTLRTHTPSASQLTTRRSYSDDSYSTGNRNLTNYYTHQAEAGWSKYFVRAGYFGVEGYLNYSNNTINSLTDITDGVDEYLNRIVSYTMPYNMGMSYNYGLSANIMYRPSGFLNIRLYANIYQSGYSLFYDKLGQNISDNMLSYSLRANLWTKLLNQYQINASFGYTSPTLSLFATRKARYSFDLGLRSDFFKRKLSVFINIRDLFNWGKVIGSGSTTTNPYYVTDATSYTINSRYIGAGITLRFGKMELERTESTTESSESSSNSSL